MPSPTKPFAELQITSSRKRRDTSSLLPSSYNPDPNIIPEVPIPEASPSLYTIERLQQSLVYAERCLKRLDITPRSELFMQIYKEELRDALEAEKTDERGYHAMMIMAEERLIQEKRFLRPLRSAEKVELEDQLLQLRELQYVDRYGDSMKITPTRLQLQSSPKRSDNWELISRNTRWSQIARTIQAEEKARDNVVRIGRIDKVHMPFSATVDMACDDLGISQGLAMWSLQEYSMRNREAHRDLNDLKREGQFSLLALILHADKDDLSSTFSLVSSETDVAHLEAIVQGEIDTMFEDTSDRLDNPAAWIPSMVLSQIYRDAKQKASQPSKEETKQADVARSQRMSEEKGARQKEASTGTSTLTAKKRIASTEEPRGSEAERQERTREHRHILLAKKCELEEELKHINSTLALIDENGISLEEIDRLVD